MGHMNLVLHEIISQCSQLLSNFSVFLFCFCLYFALQSGTSEFTNHKHATLRAYQRS